LNNNNDDDDDDDDDENDVPYLPAYRPHFFQGKTFEIWGAAYTRVQEF